MIRSLIAALLLAATLGGAASQASACNLSNANLDINCKLL